MSLGFHSEFHLGLQSILAADGDDACPPFHSLEEEGDGNLYKLVDAASGSGEFSESCDEPGKPALRKAPSAISQDASSDDLGKTKRPCSDFVREQLKASPFREKKYVEASRGGADPPHREIVTRFQRLKTIRHPHLCSYTNVLRIQRRIYAVSEHWSLSLQDIMNAWDNEGNTQKGTSAGGSTPASSGGGDGSEQTKDEATPLRCARWDVEKLQFLGILTAQTLTALAHLNSMGLAHNRLEPRNIRIDAHGNVRLSEWGLYYLTDGGNLAPSADLFPAFAYLAPEQLLAGPDVLRYAHSCSKHDVWALGIILLQILQPCWSIEVPLCHTDPRQNQFNIEDGSHDSLPSESSPCGFHEATGASGSDKLDEKKDFISLMEDMKKITQLVLYCALGVDYQVLVPFDPPDDDETASEDCISFEVPTVSAVGTELQRWLLHHMPLLVTMMEKAVGNPCCMLDPEKSRSALTAVLSPENLPLHAVTGNDAEHATWRQAQGRPAASTPVASLPLGDLETALFPLCFERLTHWLSGDSLCQRSHFFLSYSSKNNHAGLKASSTEGVEGEEEREAAGGGDFTDSCLERLMQQVREVLRACLTVHPSSRLAPCDLLAFEWLQKAQRERQLWCSKGSECIGLIAELHVEEELRRVLSDMQEYEGGRQRPLAGSGRLAR